MFKKNFFVVIDWGKNIGLGQLSALLKGLSIASSPEIEMIYN